ncbi:RING-H2 finger protein ATL8 [Platanthera guangdongensis]|uniref:RING-H2 finger protein ATL8 n=1 Tax=Platanthera guangdongensis TaxID=2320717 RepID=A0ABR2MY14_9ASPA
MQWILIAVNLDLIIILAALLCAMTCILGLALVERCTWFLRCFFCFRRNHAASPDPKQRAQVEGFVVASKDIFRRRCVAGEQMVKCLIYLAEFAHGDEVRILPQCGHDFHVGCVDMWLRSHSSCPSYRQIFIVAPSFR